MSLLKKLLETKDSGSVTDLIDYIQNSKINLKWRPVGERENNLATINLGSDPAAGLIERVTNAIDAVFHRTWIEKGQPDNVKSPREASEDWFSIEGGQVANISNFRTQEMRELSEKVVVTLHDSDNANNPTVDIRDQGVGVKSEEFKDSILSLNANRKLNKLFLAGAFGQGGSTALSYSDYTIIISKSIFNKDKVSATVVRFNPGDLQNDKHGLYEYMIDYSTGYPVTFQLDEDEIFDEGTLVRHISMDLGKYNNIMTTPTRSLWYLTHHYLFDPVIPFRIKEKRDNKIKEAQRTVAGNYRLLNEGDNTEYRQSALLNFRNGKVAISWWVLSGEGDNANKRITQYTLASKPIVITYNGQKQGELPNTIIKNDLKLPYLDKYIIVHVDCDHLDNESRRQLFPTTRESLRDTSILEELRGVVTDTLSGDEELRRLNLNRKERFINREGSSAVDNIRKRLAKRLDKYINIDGDTGDPQPTPPQDPVPRQPKTPIPVSEPPTFLAITSHALKKVYPGKRFTLNFKTNANETYFAEETFTALISSDFGTYTGNAKVKDGFGTVYFKAGENVEIGVTEEITLEIRPRKSKSISDSIIVQTIELPADKGAGKDKVRTSNINPHWINEGDEYWNVNSWDKNSVAKVEIGEDAIDIFVSAGNKNLNELLTRAQRRDEKAVENIKDTYLEHISFHALLTEINLENKNQTIVENDETDSGEPESVTAISEKELERVAETVCGMIKQVFEVIITDEVNDKKATEI